MPETHPSVATAHRDTFVRDHLPPSEAWPELLLDDPAFRYPARLNCGTELLDHAIDRHGWGARIAIHCGGHRYTYDDLRAAANRIAHVLTGDQGLIPGNRVLIHGHNRFLMAAAWLGVQKAGGVVVSTMPLLRAKELTDIIGKARISHALCERALAPELVAAAERCPTLAHVLYYGAPDTPARDSLEAAMAGKPAQFADVDTAADDPCLIAFTSGTSGLPKGTVHFHRDILTICDAFPRSTLKPTADDIFCGISSLAFTFGLGGLLLFPLRYGASAVFVEKAQPEALLTAIQTHRATLCFAVPTIYRMMAAASPCRDLSSLRACVSAGEPLPVATRETWKTLTGLDLIDGLGSTEMLHIFLSAAGPDIRPGATGKPIPGYQARVVDDAGRPLPPGEVGRLAVKGPTGCRYLDDPRQADYVRNGWNLTGDAYRVDEAGYFHYQSRVDDLIISGGRNIAGPEVEEALYQHPAVADCAVIGVPDPERSQIVKAFVVLKPGVAPSPELAQALQDHVKQAIAAYKYPRQIEFRDALPRTGTGKLQRFKLREEVRSAPPATAFAHRIIQPPDWARPRGFSNAVIARGRHLSIAGQLGWDTQGRFASERFSDQARQALANVLTLVTQAGGRADHIVRLTWYITDRESYLAETKSLGDAYRSIMGRWYPPMTVVVVQSLLDPQAKVEIEATAIIPD